MPYVCNGLIVTVYQQFFGFPCMAPCGSCCNNCKQLLPFNGVFHLVGFPAASKPVAVPECTCSFQLLQVAGNHRGASLIERRTFADIIYTYSGVKHVVLEDTLTSGLTIHNAH